MTDQEHADAIHAAVDQLKAATRRAADAGLTIGVYVVGGEPRDSLIIADVKVARVVRIEPGAPR